MNEVIMKDWHDTRKQGKTAFVIKNGVLFWGLFAAVIWSLAMHYIQPTDPVWIRALVAVIVFPAIGFYVGLVTWRKKEKEYRQREDETEARTSG